MAEYMSKEHKVSQRQALTAVSLPQSTFRYKPKQKPEDAAIEAELQKLVYKHPSIDFWQCFFRLRRKGHCWNHKRVYRIYTALKLNIRRRRKKRLPARAKQALYLPAILKIRYGV